MTAAVSSLSLPFILCIVQAPEADGPCPSLALLGWEPGLRSGVQPNRGAVSTGSGWGRKGAAARERQDGAATTDLQFRLCSLLYELEKRRGGMLTVVLI